MAQDISTSSIAMYIYTAKEIAKREAPPTVLPDRIRQMATQGVSRSQTRGPLSIFLPRNSRHFRLRPRTEIKTAKTLNYLPEHRLGQTRQIFQGVQKLVQFWCLV